MEILRQLVRVTESQDELLRRVRNLPSTEPSHPSIVPELFEGIEQQDTEATPQQFHDVAHGWVEPRPGSASSTPARSTNLAAIRWFGVLTGNGSHEAASDILSNLSLECDFLDRTEGQSEGDLTPLQRATRAVDGRESNSNLLDESVLPVETTGFLNGKLPWQSTESIPLLHEQQVLFEIFLRRISSRVCSLPEDLIELSYTDKG